MGDLAHVFKEKLEPHDRMNVEPVKLKLKEGYITPSICWKPFNTPHHLRGMYEKELKRALDAGHLAPCGLEITGQSSGNISEILLLTALPSLGFVLGIRFTMS